MSAKFEVEALKHTVKCLKETIEELSLDIEDIRIALGKCTKRRLPLYRTRIVCEYRPGCTTHKEPQ